MTYGRIVVYYRPQKEDLYLTRLTVGGNLINFLGDVGTPMTNMLTCKFLLNIVLLTPNSKFVGIDIKTLYFNVPMARYEYMRLSIDIIPQEILD